MIRLRDVQKRYSRGEQSVLACAVDSLEIAAGEQVALIGRSGTGKTTLLHILAGILRPDRGEVEIVGTRGHDVGKRDRVVDIDKAVDCRQATAGKHILHQAFY